MIPASFPPEAALDEHKREEARRQAEGGGAEAVMDGAELAVDAVGSGALDWTAQATGAVVDATGAVLNATVDVAKVSLDVVGGLLGSLGEP